MTDQSPPGKIDAPIEAEISGQVAVGNSIMQIEHLHGNVVNAATPQQQPQVRPRPTPISVRPRPFPGLLDREAEVDAASAALQSAVPVEFYGEAGLGNTAVPHDLEAALLSWVWHKEGGITYLGETMLRPAYQLKAGRLDRWFTSLELPSLLPS